MYCTDNKPPVRVKKKEKFTDQKYLSIASLQTDYLNIDSNSGSIRNNERENIAQTKLPFCRGANHSSEKRFKNIRKDRENFVRLMIWTDNRLNLHLKNF